MRLGPRAGQCRLDRWLSWRSAKFWMQASAGFTNQHQCRRLQRPVAECCSRSGTTRAAVGCLPPNCGASSSPVFAATSATDKRKLLRALLASVAGIAAALAISFVAIHSPEPTMPWQRLVVNPIVGRVPIDCLKRSSDSRLWCELVHTSDGYGLRGLFLAVEGDAECGVHGVEGPHAQAEQHCYDGRGNATRQTAAGSLVTSHAPSRAIAPIAGR